MNSDSRHPRPRWDATETHCHEFHQHPWQHAAHVDRHGTGRWPGAGWRTVRPRTDSPDRPGPALADPRRHGAGRARALLRGVLATWSSCRRLQTGILVRRAARPDEHTSELQSLMRISYAVFCLKKKNTHNTN